MKLVAVVILFFSSLVSYASGLDCKVNLIRHHRDSSGKTITEITTVNLSSYSVGGLNGFKGDADSYSYLLLDEGASLSYSIRFPNHSSWDLVGNAPAPNEQSAFTMVFYVDSGSNELTCAKAP